MKYETMLFISIALTIISAALTLLCILARTSALQIVGNCMLTISCGFNAYSIYRHG